MNLDNLDKALHDLGMLSTITEARRDFLRETKSNLNVMRLNTRYVSNVTVGYCMKKTTAKNRLCPYVMPIRHRTKSENSEAMVGSDGGDRELKGSVYEPSTSSCKVALEVSAGKRCQSLENLNLEAPARAETSPEVECVSTRIQRLQVEE